MKRFYPKNGRVILHVDMNSFYASVEMAFNPSLKGKPLAIAGDAKKRRGIIVTCSYEARKFGVKTTMPVWQAKKICPELIVIEPNFERYRKASAAMFNILREYSDLVESVSIDEGYIDITNCQQLGSPIKIAKDIQQRILRELDLPCSIGIAPNKFLAKTASDMKKPLGITILRKRDVPEKLWPLPVIEMHGVGEKTAEKLSYLNIKTIGDLAKADEGLLHAQLGIRGIQLKERANGIDNRPVDPEASSEYKSIGNSITLPEDISDPSKLLQVFKGLANKVANRLKEKEYKTTYISITISYQVRKKITRGKKLTNPTQDPLEIYQVAKSLFEEHWNGEPVRLLGITGQQLIELDKAYEQLDLFTYEKVAQKEPLYKAVLEIQKKYGESVIRRGRDI